MLTVYSRPGEPWLLVPGCLLPPVLAERLYGPLSYAGAFPPHRLTERELLVVMSQFDDASFARIPEMTARRLLAPEVEVRVTPVLGFAAGVG